MKKETTKSKVKGALVSGKSKTSKKKKLFIVGAIALPLISLILLAFSLLHNPFIESFDALFFDVGEALELAENLSADGLFVEYDMTLPTKSLSMSAKGIARGTGEYRGQNAIGAFEIELGRRGKDNPLTVAYNRDNIFIRRTASGDSQVLTIPRHNTEQGLARSIFHPDSNSRYALDEKDYNTLLKILSAIETDEVDRERVSLKKILLRVAKRVVDNVDFKRSYSFEGLSLSKTTTVSLDGEDICGIADVLLEETEENPILVREIISPELVYKIFGREYKSDVTDTQEILRAIKKMASERELNILFSFTESKGKISAIKLDTSFERNGGICRIGMDVKLEYSDGSASFVLVLNRTNADSTDVATLEYSKKTDEKEKISRVTAGLSFGKNTYELGVDYNGQTGGYGIELSLADDTVKIGGEYTADAKKGTVFFGVKEAELKGIKIKAESLVSLSLCSTKQVPKVLFEGISIFEISESDFRRFYEGIKRLL